MKLSLTRVIDCHVPTETCNLKCPYCYIGQKREFERCVARVDHTPEEVRRAFSMRRLGGVAFINFCAGGETLLGDDILPIIHEVLKEGHLVQIVTNGTVTKRFDEIVGWEKSLLERLFIKFSFHYTELLRIGMLEAFFSNIEKVRDAGCSYSLEITPGDEMVPHIEDMKKISLKHLGALPHVTVARNERTAGFEILTNYEEEEYRKIWGQFESPLFDMKMELVSQKRTEFCYAGEWSLVVNLGTGDVKQCYRGAVIDNIYDNPDRVLKYAPIGRNCPESYCYNGHIWMALGSIPGMDVPMHTGMRDRICANGTHWLNKTFRDFFSQKLETLHTVYSEDNSLPTVLLLGDSICEGYCKYVENGLNGKAKVIRPKEVGRFTTYMLQNISLWAKGLCIGSDVDVVHFNVGLWDVVRISGDEPLVSLEEYEKNLRRIVKRLREEFPNAKLIFANSTPVLEERVEYSWLRRNDDIRAYNAVAQKVMDEERISVNNLYNVVCNFGIEEYIDSVHYTESGYEKIAEHVTNAVEKYLPLKLSKNVAIAEILADEKINGQREYLKGKNIIVYGAGRYGIEVVKQLKSMQLTPRYVLDRSKAKHGNYVEEVKIVSPIEYKNQYMDFENDMLIVAIADERVMESVVREFACIRGLEIASYKPILQDN